jgi:hypothetical protein
MNEDDLKELKAQEEAKFKMLGRRARKKCKLYN